MNQIYKLRESCTKLLAAVLIEPIYVNLTAFLCSISHSEEISLFCHEDEYIALVLPGSDLRME